MKRDVNQAGVEQNAIYHVELTVILHIALIFGKT